MLDKKIILGITGSIAAYKAAELIRLLKKQGADMKEVKIEREMFEDSAIKTCKLRIILAT